MDSTGFFKSLKSTFKSANNDRNKIESSSVTDDERKQRMFDELKGGSVSMRIKAAEHIADCLYEFNPQSIPDIWYCAKDLISPNSQHNARKAGLRLLLRCVGSPTDDPSSKYVYFTDALMNCHFTKAKVDPEFEEFLHVMKIMTDNGTFIHHFQESLKQPLLEFFISALTPQEMAKSKSILELLDLIIQSIRSGIFNIDDEEAIPKFVEELLSLIIRLSLKTADSVILEHCIQVIDSLILYRSIPGDMIYETLEILCGASILDLRFYDLATGVVSDLINRTQSFDILATLIEILLCHKPKNEKNINGSIGAIKIMGYLFPNFAYQIDIASLLSALHEVISWNKPTLLVAVLRFINDSLLSDVTLNQIAAPSWDAPEGSILSLLSVINGKISKDEEIELYMLALIRLQNLGESTRYPGQTSTLVSFFISNPKYLSTKACIDVLRYYAIHNLCSPLHENWKDNLGVLLRTFYFDESKDITVRIACVKLLSDVFDASFELFEDDDSVFTDIWDIGIVGFENENSSEVLKEYLNNFNKSSISWPLPLYQKFLDHYIAPRLCPFNAKERRSSLGTLANLRISDKNELKPFNQKISKAVVKSLVTNFALTLLLDGQKAQVTYNLLISVAKSALSKKNVDLLLITSRLFVRIRASATKQVYLTNPTDMDGLAAAFSRNLNLRKSNDASGTVSLDEKWVYPEEIEYIPEESIDKPSDDLTIVDNSSSKLDMKAAIDIQPWLSIVIQILESAPHWEIYSFMYSHFCPQLSNIKLYESCGDEIRHFRSLVCEQLTLKLPSNLDIPENMSKQDLQVAIVRNFTPLISYNALFSKQDEDQIISALLVGLSSWEKTAIPCIHILTICCYELPLSVKKFLSAILTKLQTRISSAFASAHILEFLLALSYIPTLTSNFTVDEFKRAFGITFKLIQYAHDIAEVKDNQHHGVLTHGEELEAELLPSTENLEITPVISMYLLSLSYDVIANWFLNMHLSDRRQLSSFIIKNLILSQSNHGTDINNQNMSFIDLITRFTYSDLELNFSPINPRKFASEDPVLSSKWVYGNSVIGIDTHATTGESIISIRRASGSTVFRVIPDESMIPYYTNQLHSRHDDDDLFSSNYILLQMIVHPGPAQSAKPIPIPDEIHFTRSLANFDRIPVVEFHKIGLLYIGPNQTTEHQILSNSKGSEEYEKFLSNFGRPIKLKGCKSFYVGGLDTENDADGSTAYGWNDKILQLIFHTTTLMPSSDEDANFSAKKRHIGNNYVNIFFDESGHPFDFNVIKSQFNFLNIVIQPHSISFGSKEGGSSKSDDSIKKYKVKVHRRSGVPGLFATCHFKIVSEENLPTFVRTLALVCDHFAQVWHSNGRYASNWSHRMRQLMMIREKASKAHDDLKSVKAEENGKEQKSTAGQGFLDQLSEKTTTVTTGGRVNSNKYEFTEDDDNEILKNLEFTSFTK
jgi:hypothetical protein